MAISSAIPMNTDSNQAPLWTAAPPVGLQAKAGRGKPVEDARVTTRPSGSVLRDVGTMNGAQRDEKRYFPPVVPTYRTPIADAIPLQIWEGTVVDVDESAQTMQVELNAKLGRMPRHIAEISLEWVSEQDRDLVCPGAVFYLTLFKRTRRGGSIENAQELRFRRRPSWSAAQIAKVESDAELLLSKMKVPTIAE